MVLENLTRLGDKIDIQLIQQLEKAGQGELEDGVRTYKSSVFDFISDWIIEIAMPTENRRMVLFQVGLRCKMFFYTQKGLYTCNAIVQKRYKKENFFVLAMQIVSEPVKFQRREFFRIDCVKDVKYVPIDDNVVKLETTKELIAELQKPEYKGKEKHGITMDISGGGVRFSTVEKLEPNQMLAIEIKLTSNDAEQTYCLVTRIISSERLADGMDKFVNRGQFLFKNLRERENIVRFVFEEERRLRKKEIG